MELEPDVMTRQVAFLTHSLLNPAADAGRHPASRGPVLPVVSTLRDLGCELVQLPAAGLPFPRATGFDVGLTDVEVLRAVHELRRFLRQSATRFAG